MRLPPGARLGAFEILAPLGAGGMGEVYRARDPRLGRDVAIKILPERYAADAHRAERLRREARAASRINHPNVVTVFDVGEQDGLWFVVCELVEGRTLRSFVNEGPLGLTRAIGLSQQLAAGLAAAHEQGIVHRDLKPENVIVTADGRLKILDFGIARIGDDGRGVGSETATETTPGTLLGTSGYTSPEQARGEAVDPRTDLFALGAILFELLAGEPAFLGTSTVETLTAVLRDDPLERPVARRLPEELREVLRRCLAKSPAERFRSASDLGFALAAAKLSGGKRAFRPSLRRAATVLMGATVLALAWTAWQARQEARGPLYLTLAGPESRSGHGSFELSPDGRQLAYVGWSRERVSSLWVRRLEEPKERELAGTIGAMQPFWSPDGRWLGFFADGKLKKIPATGGPTQDLAAAPSPSGGTWSRQGVIVFAPAMADGLYGVSADGGPVRPLTEIASEEVAHRWPFFLGDGDHFVFLGDSSRTEHHQIRLGSLSGGPSPQLVQAVSNPAFAAGQLLYVHGGTLLARRLNVDRGRLEGDPVQLAENVNENGENHHFQFSAVPGLLAFRSVDRATRFVWIDRQGRTLQSVGDPGNFGDFELSSDERRLAYSRLDADGRVDGVWWRDLVRGVVTRVVASGERGLIGYPVWSPSADRLALAVSTRGFWHTAVARLGDPAPPRPLLETAIDDLPGSWSPDGRWIAFVRRVPEGENDDIWVASVADGTAMPFAAADHDEIRPVFSPDGHWIAYTANPSGSREVYLQSFPRGGAPIRISHSGGDHPAWRGDGRELFYVSPSLDLVAVPLAGAGDELVPETPQALFGLEAGDHPRLWWFGVAPARDGSRFLALENLEKPALQPIRLVVGWQPP